MGAMTQWFTNGRREILRADSGVCVYMPCESDHTVSLVDKFMMHVTAASTPFYYFVIS